MNERIKEFAQQANAWYPDGYPSAEGGDEAWQNLVIFEKEDLEKFTELIVNNVLNIVAISGEHCSCSTLFRKISEHFGVEE